LNIRRIPEILAPAGNMESLRAGVLAGADAVYLGVNEGFNARARADNFSLDSLAEAVQYAHRGAARVFVTLNTLVFQSELDAVARVIQRVAESGADALIVQDPAVALLAREICPQMDLHASTQMTISSPEAAPFAAALGCNRVVVPRELSVAEIERFAAGTELELEVFIHGALCMAWSGQCLSSEAWGGRSANRGQCAQACRLPYELIVDGAWQPTGDVRYFLSPRDLAGYAAVPALMQIGVHSLKIEGRLKGPAYVMSVVQGLRRWIDAIADGRTAEHLPDLAADIARMQTAYSRGFSPGFFGGSNHQHLVEGTYPRHRGRLAGRVVRTGPTWVDVERYTPEPRPVLGQALSPLPAQVAGEGESGVPEAPIELLPGMGVAFDTADAQDREAGGMVFQVTPRTGGWRVEFRRGTLDPSEVAVGARVWITGDQRLQNDTQRLLQQEVSGRLPIDLLVSGGEGQPLRVDARWAGRSFSAASASPLTVASSRALDDELLRSKLGAFGGTPFRLRSLDTAALGAGLFLSPSELKQIRREIVEAMQPLVDQPVPRAVVPAEHALGRVQSPSEGDQAPTATERTANTQLVPLVRTPEQLEAVIELGFGEVELDWMELVGLGKAVDRCRRAGVRVVIATVRVQKPGEEGYDRRIDRLEPDGVLVRHWAAVQHFAMNGRRDGLAVHGDFSLNVTNTITFDRLIGAGLDTITLAHDLDAVQADALIAAATPARAAITVHHHIPTFHTEHCIYAHQLSQGRDFRTCGRPCDHHRVALRDEQGREHPILVDVGCRNTVFNAAAQTAASVALRWVAAGVGRFRLEFVWETADQTRTVLEAWREFMAGQLTAQALVRRIGVHEQFGVSSGTMRTMELASL
jgi:putative protease